ncbi:hypothetical protein Ae201684P_002258 [Aphanomyces euteiches]|uniref:Uncharacterized protein n=1 Tax=Aphanomyces euteiches TaxID=100861 RepID=A0A6G0X2A9_9STRA|nr:hypothetical protein Ae201684_009471 [Aphanomyces euteiches]KAH9069883.1 hypothetical protein Ae201684P_002258 [Aphanomyces euteiches]
MGIKTLAAQRSLAKRFSLQYLESGTAASPFRVGSNVLMRSIESRGNSANNRLQNQFSLSYLSPRKSNPFNVASSKLL